MMELLQRNIRGELYEERLGVGLVVAGKWELTEHLGSGGFGHVYEGWHLELDGPFALKFLDAAHSSAEAKAQFLEEARMMNRLADRKHLVHVSDFGALPDGMPYFVMERLWGKTLRQRLVDEPQLPISEAIAIIAELLEGLAQVHDRGLVHGDIKPENIFLSEKGTRVRLLDFGLTKTSALTSGSGVGGTPPYMAPEVLLEGQPAERRSDLYAVGAVLYEMLAGRLPRGHLQMGLDRARKAWSSGSTQSVRMHRGQVPDAVCRLVDEAVSRNPEARPKTARAMLERLRTSVNHIAFAPTLKAERPRAATATDVTPAEVVSAESSQATAEPKPPSTGAPSEPANEVTVLDPAPVEPSSREFRVQTVWVASIIVVLAVMLGLGIWHWAGPWSAEHTIASLPVSHDPNWTTDTPSTTTASFGSVDGTDASSDHQLDQDSTLTHDNEEHGGTTMLDEGPVTDASPAPEPGKPKRSTKPAHTTEKCRKIREAAHAALDQRRWNEVVGLARQKRCWSPGEQSSRTRLQVNALLESGRFEDCIVAAGRPKDPSTLKMMEICKKKVK